MANTELTKMRWALGLNGAPSVAFGVVFIVWPGISLVELRILFGVYARASGVVSLGSAFGPAGDAPAGLRQRRRSRAREVNCASVVPRNALARTSAR
jgi:uncharacterized membrane protein HdeD (DUF308 family)